MMYLELERKLSEAPWEVLECADGTSAWVPDSIRQLLAPDRRVQELALDDLREGLGCRGSIYEATASAVKPLIEVLKIPTFEHCADVLELLFRFGQGKGVFTAHQTLGVIQGTFGLWEIQKRVKEEGRIAEQLHQALLSGFDLFIALLENPDENIQLQAIGLVGLLPEKASKALPVLKAVSEKTTSASLAAAAKQAIETLAKGAGQF